MVPIFLFTLIGCCLFIVYGALIDYYRRAWTAIPEFVPSGKTGLRPCHTRISVLIPARNEAKNIASCIESLFLQSYPKNLYQVIVIDDHSTDATPEIVQDLRYPDMDLICARLADIDSPPLASPPLTSPELAGPQRASPQLAYKKLAIGTGVQIASGELIVTTDADCRFHPDWLTTIAAFYEEKNAKFIAAPVRIGDPLPARHSAVPAGDPLPAPHHNHSTAPGSPTFLSIFQTLDFITLQGITGAAVAKKFHSMCNGANLAYQKNAFIEVGGFSNIDDIPSGDDMLLMHKIYNKYPDSVWFLKSPRAIASTQPETTWSGFIHQRVRWASKADRYDDKRIFRVLLLVYLVNFMFVILPVAACWDRRWLWLFLIALLTKTLLEYPFVSTVARFFGQRALMKWFPFLQPLHIVYTVVIGWMGKFGSYRWKDRKITK
ncbi:MAG TPA: glycosyltransferase [Puia sp.]|nr:glycosyltransferase [Puia sp.]